jgi:hypothetical protein
MAAALIAGSAGSQSAHGVTLSLVNGPITMSQLGSAPTALAALTLGFNVTLDESTGFRTLAFDGSGAMTFDGDVYTLVVSPSATAYELDFDEFGDQSDERGSLAAFLVGDLEFPDDHEFTLSITDAALDLALLAGGTLQLTIPAPPEAPEIATTLHLTPNTGRTTIDFENEDEIRLEGSLGVVPEPSSLVLAAAGAATIAARRTGRRRGRR